MGRDVKGLSAPGAVPFVDGELELFAPREQRLVHRNEFIQHRG
jgi:hypothetical protein